MDENFKAVILHGFTGEQALQVMRAVKALGISPQDTAFATTTPSNLKWKVSELVEQLSEEHAYMKINRDRNRESSP
ncbi:MAG: DUF3783 domain-containing protein [Spirochaetaceae bacterium]|nr:DUF3783 domain-containing protein [Spirochaetaceae bacterium]